MSKNKETKLCKYCKTEIPSGARICPNCQKKQGGITKWGIIALVVIVIGAASIGNNSNKDKQKPAISENTKTPSENSSVIDKDKTEDTSTTKQPSNDATSEPEPENNTKEENIPTEYKSALNSAETYSDMMNMSKAAIYDQLISEYGDKFSKKAAKYAIDNLDADWNKNALLSAESYQDTMDMSPSAIYDQLISEYGDKFTKKQAKYAIDHLK